MRPFLPAPARLYLFSCFKISAVLTIHTSHFDIPLHNALSYLTTLCENLSPLEIQNVRGKWYLFSLFFFKPLIWPHSILHSSVDRVEQTLEQTLARNEINPMFIRAPTYERQDLGGERKEFTLKSASWISLDLDMCHLI